MRDHDLSGLLGKLAEQQYEVLSQLKQLLSEQSQLRQRQADIEENLLRLTPSRKDGWDRRSAMAPIVSAALIASIGAYFTWSYNLQQLKVQEIQTIERFIPHLTGSEKSKRAAILAISSLGNASLAGKVAAIFASEGTVSALKSIAQTSEPRDRLVLNSALAKTLDNLADKYSYENKFDEAVAAHKQALIVKEAELGKDSPDLADNLDKLAALYESHGNHALSVDLSKKASALRKGIPGAGDALSAIAGRAAVQKCPASESTPLKSQENGDPAAAAAFEAQAADNSPEGGNHEQNILEQPIKDTDAGRIFRGQASADNQRAE